MVEREPHHPITLRRRVALACIAIALLLLGLNFVNPPGTNAPYLLFAGIALLLLGLAMATLRRGPRRKSDASAGGASRVAAADVAELEPSPPVALPRADVTLR